MGCCASGMQGDSGNVDLKREKIDINIDPNDKETMNKVIKI